MIGIVFLSSCEQKTEPYTKLDNNISYRKIKIEDHDYLQIKCPFTCHEQGIGYVHDPECQNCKNKQK